MPVIRVADLFTHDGVKVSSQPFVIRDGSSTDQTRNYCPEKLREIARRAGYEVRLRDATTEEKARWKPLFGSERQGSR